MKQTRHHDLSVDRVRCAVITVSDTRTPETDKSGQLVLKLLERAGHEIASYEIVSDDYDAIRALIKGCCESKGIDAVLVTGGTGIAPRDTTYEAIESLLDKRLDGFGELFRQLSYDQIGSAAMLSRACAGVKDDIVIFSMPGSPKAVELAMEKLILPQLGHAVALLRG